MMETQEQEMDVMLLVQQLRMDGLVLVLLQFALRLTMTD